MNRIKSSISTRIGTGLLVIALFLAGCAAGGSLGSGGNNTSTPTATSTPGAPVILVSTRPGVGSFLVDSRGMVLYINSKDSPGISTCSGSCTEIWPPLIVTDAPVAGKGVAGLLGVLSRPDGRQQVTYDGWPLYYFSGDQKPGYASGDGYGGVWFAAFLASSELLSMQLSPTPNAAGNSAGPLSIPNSGGSSSSQLQNPAPLLPRPTPRPFPRFGGGGRPGQGRH